MVDGSLEHLGLERAGDDAVVVRLHVQPAAGRTALVGRHGPALRVRVAAPPVGGRANDACAKLLAGTFGIKRGDVELVSGASSRAKRFKVPVSADEAVAAVERALGQASGGNQPPASRR